VCSCLEGFTGNPYSKCNVIEERSPLSPCNPSPCGTNAVCKVKNGKPTCSCIKPFKGNPNTGCNHECFLNSDCPASEACVVNKCVNPCNEQTCGINANCQVENHFAMCSCLTKYFGDPYTQCSMIPHRNVTRDPCTPSPCGPQDICVSYDGKIATCNQKCVENDYSCRPQCIGNSECPPNMACINRRCANPCLGKCGFNSICNVISHNPVCNCMEGTKGNPYENCSPDMRNEPKVTCNNILCGENAECSQRGKVFKCVCKKEFYGDALVGCHPECRTNPECPPNKACQQNKCVDPCEGACGVNALCSVKNNMAICSCPPRYIGNAYVRCQEEPKQIFNIENPCDPSPCGPYSRCHISVNIAASCSCLPHAIGSPPNCRPECVDSSECLYNQACFNQKCIDPCVGTCGNNAECTVFNHNPICTCPQGYKGDPSIACFIYEEPPVIITNPCEPSPCGPNSVCQINQKRPVCSCMTNMIGKPPYCKPECLVRTECPLDKTCVNSKCVDPCKDACGSNANCQVVDHTPTCSCKNGYRGDAFVECIKDEVPSLIEPRNPCDPFPCAPNAECSVYNGNKYSCKCIYPYRGDPYTSGCRPECVSDNDCSQHLSCMNQHCRDPCPGVCGRNAECTVVNHIPSCHCSRGMIGNPFDACKEEPKEIPSSMNPCEPSPCGPNTICRVGNDRPICSCLPDMKGSPPNCRPECVVSSECKNTEVCRQNKCHDPCPGPCGLNADCRVHNHNTICTCPEKYIGDPFVMCTPKRE
jgi:hypothetical protein